MTSRTRALRIVVGAEAARASVLARASLQAADLPDAVRTTLREVFGEDLDAPSAVRRIIEDVRATGDEAVARYTQRFDRSAFDTSEVTRAEIDAAFRAVDPDLVEAITFMADRVRRYHETQQRHAPRGFTEHGLGQIVRPMQRAGIYMAGTDAVLPSSIIHTVVPARVAGVEEIVGVSAARADGTIHPLKLVAAEVAGVQRIFRASGAQAVAALAFGTASIPRVDKIFGPGGLFVTLAKQQLYGTVGIDALFGPTETLVLADDSAAPDLCAADLLAQAEHDVLATPVLITTSLAHAEEVAAAVDEQLATLERASTAAQALARGGAVVASSLDEAVELANEFAPEHFCLLTRENERLVPLVRNAGGIFVGESSPEVLGDYVAGPSHVMPTGGSARFASPLSVNDFLRVISLVDVSPSEFRHIGPYAATLARAEGLTGHARAIEMRLEGR
ncbi:MAG: histidinol dehydrogenase [Dehalococcoidia bacterium]|nr:histidinol dehydrogenase [Dehalococcoidia bacterium]